MFTIFGWTEVIAIYGHSLDNTYILYMIYTDSYERFYQKKINSIHSSLKNNASNSKIESRKEQVKQQSINK